MNKQEFRPMVAQLKKVLKAKKITYESLAKKLKMSASGVKKIFSGNDCQMGRFFEICEIAGVTIFDLVNLVRDEESAWFNLNEEQERFFADNPKYFYFFELVRAGNPVDEIAKEYQLDDTAIFRYIKRLDDLGLAEALPENKIRLKVQGRLRWLENGPLRKVLGRKDVETFIGHLLDNCTKKNHMFKFSSDSVRPETLSEFLHKLEELIKDFRGKAYRDIFMYKDSELIPVTFCIGVVPDAHITLSRDIKL